MILHRIVITATFLSVFSKPLPVLHYWWVIVNLWIQLYSIESFAKGTLNWKIIFFTHLFHSFSWGILRWMVFCYQMPFRNTQFRSRLETHLDLGEYSFKETLDSILFWASLGTRVWILLIRPNRASCVLPESHLEYQCGWQMTACALRSLLYVIGPWSVVFAMLSMVCPSCKRQNDYGSFIARA